MSKRAAKSEPRKKADIQDALRKSMEAPPYENFVIEY
jgi:hypothetical protein